MTTGNITLNLDDILTSPMNGFSSVTGYNGSAYTATGAYTGAYAASGVYTSTGTGGLINPIVISQQDQSGKLCIAGDKADIEINGKSMRSWMEKVEQRLAMLEPNKKLETEWEELKELGQRYRELEKQITEKMKTWDILKQE